MKRRTRTTTIPAALAVERRPYWARPSIGRWVHYVNQATPAQTWPALVMSVTAASVETVGLNVHAVDGRTPLVFHLPAVKYSENPEPGCWHWARPANGADDRPCCP